MNIGNILVFLADFKPDAIWSVSYFKPTKTFQIRGHIPDTEIYYEYQISQFETGFNPILIEKHIAKTCALGITGHMIKDDEVHPELLRPYQNENSH
jgi:hypothetical protein